MHRRWPICCWKSADGLRLRAATPTKPRPTFAPQRALRRLVIPLNDVIRRSQLRAIPGVGDAIARRIIELRDKGTDEALERMRGKIPSRAIGATEYPATETNRHRETPRPGHHQPQ